MSKKKRRFSPVNETKEERLGAYRQSKKNLEDIDKPRKKISQSFTARFNSGECNKCWKGISEGETVRYDSEGNLVHARHTQQEIHYEICNSCFLTLPCECEE